MIADQTDVDFLKVGVGVGANWCSGVGNYFYKVGV